MITAAALEFRVNDYYTAYIYSYGVYDNLDFEHGENCQLGDNFFIHSFKKPEDNKAIIIAESLDGKAILRFTETKEYIIRLKRTGDEQVELPRFQNESNKGLKVVRDDNTLKFQFVNYLGRSKVFFQDIDGERILVFEIVPNKIGYEDDYIRLTEDIADHCAELLLDYTGPTSNVFKLVEENSKTFLEQFIFLRKFCFGENINGLFEMIKRNPDRILVEEEELRPIGLGKPSKKVFSNPFKYAQNWHKCTSMDGREYYLPSEIAVSRKYDNLDTPANRFVKFALEQFDEICEKLIVSLSSSEVDKQAECRKEAIKIHDMIEDILNDSFFDDIKPLSVMVQNNQVLQKRDGYSQLFMAYSMLDLALQLDWTGKDDVYEGESKDIALLYEYWLFFELCKVVKSIEGCTVVQAEVNPFIDSKNDMLTISLKQGKASCRSFEVASLGLKINLYYNRTFKPTEFRTTLYEGSYSRPFRPDYTLAVFPISYGKEEKAIKEGSVSYIHFDAKYRITDITSFIKNNEFSDDEYDRELEQEKNDEVINTYKRGDLLKMHTYNDAIRRTIGSYVLYPGTGSINNGSKNSYSMFDEILPGVGAFAIKPSNRIDGEDNLKRFITNIIVEKSQNSSRLNRLNYYSEVIVREPSSSKTVENSQIIINDKNYSEDLYIIGYMRFGSQKAYYNHLVNMGLTNAGGKFYFYYYAIKDGVVYSHHHDIDKAVRLRIFKNNIDETGTYDLEGFECKILTKELMSKADLVAKLNDKIKYETTVADHHADYYYVLEVEVLPDEVAGVSLDRSKVMASNGNDSFSPHSPKVLVAGFVDTLVKR